MTHLILALMIIYFGVGLVGWSFSGAQPAVTASLSAGVTASDATMPVNSVSGYPSAGWLYIRGEAINYTATTTTCPAPFAGEPACFTGAARGRQETTAISHPLGARVYNEASGALNTLSGFESRKSIDELGEVETPWGAGSAIVRFLSQNATWDWPMFEGDFAIIRYVGSMITIAGMLGVFYLLGSLLVSAIRTIRP